jgi:aryl-alcohol dehydrogenase-like predicted oxidoreductase
MTTRTIGGRTVGAVGLGCMSFAGFYGPTTPAESSAALSAALDAGVTHWDTANVYGPGTSEEIIGAFFKANPGARHRVHLATKGAITRRADGTRVFDNSAEHLTAALDASLRRLGVETIDLYYIHRRDQRVPLEDLMGTLTGFMRAGKIRGIGLSEVAPATIRSAAALAPLTAVQSEYSLWTRLPELGVIQACRAVGATFVPFSPLGRGIFTATLKDATAFGAADFRRDNPRFLEPNFSRNLAALKALFDFAAARGVTPGQVALAWVLAQGDDLLPIPGTRSPAHVTENAAAARLVLTPADRAELDRILPMGFAHGDRYNDQQNIGPERYA